MIFADYSLSRRIPGCRFSPTSDSEAGELKYVVFWGSGVLNAKNQRPRNVISSGNLSFAEHAIPGIRGGNKWKSHTDGNLTDKFIPVAEKYASGLAYFSGHGKPVKHTHIISVL